MNHKESRVERWLQRHGLGAQHTLKRTFDLAVCGGALVALSPLLALIGTAIKAESKGPAFFLQERVGKGGKTFVIWKFRTMVEGSEKGDLILKKNDARVTKVGELLRKTSLDELPQLINIVLGDMSIIGPRPTLAYQVEQYDEVQRRRLDALPGVTGWAQIHGRNALPWPERIELDVWYVEHWSLWLDLQILLRTIPVVLGQEGVYGDRENFTMFAQQTTANSPSHS